MKKIFYLFVLVIAFSGNSYALESTKNKSFDRGYTFEREEVPVCMTECNQCPCDPDYDQVQQQQYPRVFYNGKTMTMFYEF